MKITNEFAVTVPIDRAWAVLTDLEGLAPCLPGAQLTDVDGDVYQGRVRVKVGPVVSEFAGTARFVEKDDAAYRGVIDAKGRDARSTGTASALVTAHLRPDGDRTLVSVDTDLKISGKLAQFGSGMIKEVSGKLLTQFVANLEAKLAAEPPAPHPNAQPVAATSAAPPAPSGIGPSDVGPSDVGPSDVGPSGDAVRVAPTAEPEALDLLSIAGGSVTKRLVPVVVGLVAVGAVIAWLVARR
ncbi:SRPBCC family protein [Micromonospora sp. NPDC047762]|uniref:SRPBCC family protein n=1 Tax=Micromonospora sp. NPDC047762 TaxID=3364255 RepID=UPI00371A7DE2